MAYEAEISTDRMHRHANAKGTTPTRVTRLGTTEIGAALRTDEKGKPYRVEIITYLKGWHVTLTARVFQSDANLPQKTVTLLDGVHLDRLFENQFLSRRSAGGQVLPALLPGEPDLTD